MYKLPISHKNCKGARSPTTFESVSWGPNEAYLPRNRQGNSRHTTAIDSSLAEARVGVQRNLEFLKKAMVILSQRRCVAIFSFSTPGILYGS